MSKLAMHLDLALLDAEEPAETLEEIGDMVGSDEPGFVLVCHPCNCKRYVPSSLGDKYARLSSVKGFQLLHGACALQKDAKV